MKKNEEDKRRKKQKKTKKGWKKNENAQQTQNTNTHSPSSLIHWVNAVGVEGNPRGGGVRDYCYFLQALVELHPLIVVLQAKKITGQAHETIKPKVCSVMVRYHQGHV